MAELKKVDRKTRKEKVEKIIEQTGLKDVEKKLTRNLSRGYKQRVSMAGALVEKAGVFDIIKDRRKKETGDEENEI